MAIEASALRESNEARGGAERFFALFGRFIQKNFELVIRRTSFRLRLGVDDLKRKEGKRRESEHFLRLLVFIRKEKKRNGRI